MGLFKSIKLYNNVSTHVDTVANGFINSMKYEGYDVVGTKMPSGEWDISIKKGDLLRAVVGMQTAMKVVITPNTPHVYVKTGVGIFGQQAIPSLLTAFVFHPLLILQVWGLIKQYKLDEIVSTKINQSFNRATGRIVTPKIIE